jgi:hypothetical protein
MIDRPLELLRRDENLAERGIDFCLAGIEASRRRDGVLVLQYEPFYFSFCFSVFTSQLNHISAFTPLVAKVNPKKFLGAILT